MEFACDGLSRKRGFCLLSLPSYGSGGRAASPYLSRYLQSSERCQQGARRAGIHCRARGRGRTQPCPSCQDTQTCELKEVAVPGMEGFASSTGVCACGPCLQKKQLLSRGSSLLTPNVFLSAWLRQEPSFLCPGWAPAVAGAPAWCVLVSREPQAPVGSLSCAAPGAIRLPPLAVELKPHLF